MSQFQLKNIATQRFGRLLAIAPFEQTPTGNWKWVCVCDCGRSCLVTGWYLTCGDTKSCGCLRSAAHHRTHGKSGTTIHNIYSSIVQRCNNPKNHAYKDYGGRGIQCKFKSFEEFYTEVGEPPGPGLTLDRRDNMKSYQKGNMRWVTRLEQANNKRSNHIITHNGITLTQAAWARKLGMGYLTLVERFNRGWSVERALTVPVRQHSSALWLTYQGTRRRLTDWARIFHISYDVLSARLHAGWSPKRALTEPVHHEFGSRRVTYSSRSG